MAVLAVQVRTQGASHPSAITTRTNLIKVRADLGRHAEAIAIGREAVALAEPALGDAHPLTLIARAALGASLMRSGLAGTLEEAERLLLETHALMVESQGEQSPMAIRARADLAELYGPGRLDDPEQWERWSQGAKSARFPTHPAP